MKKNVVIIILSILVLGLGGYLVYDKVLEKEETNVNNKNEEEIVEQQYDEITIEELLGTYTWVKNRTDEHGNQIDLKITLVLNSDGTATYDASDGYSYEATKGSYVYEDGQIIYTRKNYNYRDESNTVVNGDVYEENNQNEVFIVVDENTLQNTYRNETTQLKK